MFDKGKDVLMSNLYNIGVKISNLKACLHKLMTG